MRICKNDITDEIRSKFGANPLKVPDSTYQPLLMLGIENRRPQFLGYFEDLIIGDFNYELPKEISQLAHVSGSETNKVDIKVGFSILGNFIKAFSDKSPDLKSTFNKTKKISFEFSNVQREWFSVLRLGKILSNNSIKAADNIFVQRIMDNRRSKLALITDIITSNSFSFNSYSEKETAVNIDVPLFEDVIGDAEIDLKVHKVKDNEIKFERLNPLTFAFSCIELIIDDAGNFKSGDWIKNVGIRKAMDSKVEASLEGEIEVEAKYLIDEDDYNLLLIEHEN